MKDYASLRKKHNASRTIAMIMALLLIVEMCSLTMLFSRVVGYSTDGSDYVISLTEGADKSKFSKLDTAKTGFIVPTFVADPDIYFIEPEDKINEKDFGFSTYDKDQIWTTDTEGEIFHLTYDQDREELTVVSDGTFKRDGAKVFAPGTGEHYKFTVSNSGTADLKYLVYLEAWIDAQDPDGNDLWIPLNSKFYNAEGTYFGADGTSDWHEFDYIDKTGEIRPLAKGSSRDYYVDWEWPFERFDGEGLEANDAYDTMLGDLAAAGSDLRAYIRIKTVAWVEDYWHIYTDVIEGKGTTTEDPDMVVQYNDETSTITAVPAEGYEFVEWVIDDDDIYEIMDGGSLTDPILTIKPGSDVHAHAIFRLKATEEPTTPTEEPTKAYWIVDTDVIEGKGTTTPPVEDPAKVEQGSGETVTIIATPDEDYEFIGWEIDGDYTLPEGGSLTDPTLVIKPESDVHAHAIFRPKATEPPTEPIAYWIVDTDVIQGKGTTTPPVSDPAQVVQGSGDTVTITAVPDEGFEFIGWEIDGDYTLPEGGSLTDPTLVIKPESDVHAHAKFKPLPKYWIVDTDVIEGKGTTTPPVEAPVQVEQGKGETVTITAVPEEGYEFIGWEIDGDYTLPEGGTLSDPTLVLKPASDIHAHAKFRPIPKYWIVDTDVIEGKGTTTPPVENPVKVEQGSGDTVVITATPEDGYEFIGWEIDGDYTLPEGGSLTDPNLILLPNSDIHAHAKFRPVTPEPKYWIVDTDVIEGEGTTAPTKENPVKVIQNNDETVTITADPADGYEFIGWEIDGDYSLPEGGSLSDPTLVIQPGSDVHAHARFVKKVVPTEPSTEAPTAAPTVSPTVAPTQAPTAAPVTPKTGDFTNNLLWLIVAISAFAALIILFIVYRKVRKREKAED